MSRRWFWRGLVAAIVVVVGVVALLVTSTDDATISDPLRPTVVSVEELREEAADSELPIYWAGEIDGTELQLARGNEGSSLLTYLPATGEAGDAVDEGDIGTSLAIGTYPMEDPEAALAATKEEPGAIVRESPEVGDVVTNRRSRSSVYFADPDGGVQVEVFHPEPAKAMQLAISGEVRPVE